MNEEIFVKQIAIESLPYVQRPDVKVLLINPPQSYPNDIADEYQSYFPVGIASLGASIRIIDVQVKLLDCLASENERKEDGLTWFGMGDEEITEEIKQFAPHIVGICNAFSMFANDTVRIANLVKAIDQNIQIIVGGIEASVKPNNFNYLRNNPSIDILVKGEGEITLRELVQNFDTENRIFRCLNSTLGIMYRNDSNDVVENAARPWIEDLDQLPFPAYDLLNMEKMFSISHYAKWRGKVAGRRCLPMHTSRGCPYSCSFCSVHSQVGKPSRRHSPEYVLKHIQFVIDQYNVSHIHFEDDNLTINPRHTKQLFDTLKPLGITFDTPNGIRADTVTPETAQLFKDAGATFITIAVESGVQSVLDNIVRKSLNLDDAIIAAKSLHDVDLPCFVFFIIGFPGETEKEVRETLRFAKNLAKNYNTINILFVANPLPGTPLYQECIENEYLTKSPDKESLFRAIRLNQSALIETPQFTKQMLFNWTREELQEVGIFVGGHTTPFFIADNPTSWRRFSKWVGSDRELKKENVPYYKWEFKDSDDIVNGHLQAPKSIQDAALA